MLISVHQWFKSDGKSGFKGGAAAGAAACSLVPGAARVPAVIGGSLLGALFGFYVGILLNFEFINNAAILKFTIAIGILTYSCIFHMSSIVPESVI